MRALFKFFILSLILLSSCKSSKNEEVQTPTPTPKPTPPVQINYEISLAFNRLETTGLDNIQVVASITRNGTLTSGLSPSITATKGSLSSVTDNGNGTYTATLTPTSTGEYPVTVTYDSVSITRTPIVLADVHSDWGQPISVPGYVNTDGYEDGVTVTPDGEYLFVQTGPHYFSGIFVMQVARASGGCGGATSRLTPTRCNHDWIDNLIGSYTAPERPGFFDGRFNGNTLLHNSNSWNIANDASPNYALSTMFYGFKRQADGTFKEPFYVAFDDDNDALINPYGMSFLMNGDGTALMTFTFNDPTDPDMVDFDGDGNDDAESYFDVYHTTINLGQNNSLGEFVYSGTPGSHPVRGTTFNSSLVNFGKTGINGIAGTQGNSHLFKNSGSLNSIWIDDEFDTLGSDDSRDLSVHVLTSGNINSGTWTKVKLPSNVNQAEPYHEIQPYFNGQVLYFTRSQSGTTNPEVFYSTYSGSYDASGYGTNGNWGTPIKILASDTDNSIGNIVSVGEPTEAVYNGETYLYFVYAVVRASDPQGTGVLDYNLQAGFIKKK